MIMCLCEGRRRKEKVRWKNLQSKHNHQYHRIILGNFFIWFHRHFNKKDLLSRIDFIYRTKENFMTGVGGGMKIY